MTGKKFLMTSFNFGIYCNVSGLLTGSKLQCVSLLSQDLFDIITRDSSAWFFSQYAICDAGYCFSFVDVGEYGSNNYSGVLNNSQMGKLFKRNEVKIQNPSEIEGTDVEHTYFLAVDEMSPFSGKSLINEKRKIFNYRLS